MLKKIRYWLFPDKVKIEYIPERCRIVFFMLNIGLVISIVSSLVITIVKLTPMIAVIIPAFIATYFILYFTKVRPFLNDEVIVIEGEIVKEPKDKKHLSPITFLQFPTRNFVTIQTGDSYCELPVEDNFEGSKGEIIAVYVKADNIIQRSENIYRISDYYFIEPLEYNK